MRDVTEFAELRYLGEYYDGGDNFIHHIRGIPVQDRDIVSKRDFKCRNLLVWDFFASCALLVFLLAIYF